MGSLLLSESMRDMSYIINLRRKLFILKVAEEFEELGEVERVL